MEPVDFIVVRATDHGDRWVQYHDHMAREIVARAEATALAEQCRASNEHVEIFGLVPAKG